MTKQLPRLRRAVDRRNAQWLEEAEPEIFAAIDAELAEGATVDDVVRTVTDASSAQFTKMVRSAARWLKAQS